MGFYRGPKIVTNGLVLYLDAANKKSYPGTGTTWTDLSGFGNNGTLTNGPTFNSANGGSIVFDGVNDYTATNNYSLDFDTRSFTLIAWIKTSNNIQQGKIINKGQSSAFPVGSKGYSLRFYDRVVFAVTDGVNSNNASVTNINDVKQNQWCLLSGVCNRETSTVFLYVNGLINNSVPITVGSISNPNAELTIGNLRRGVYGQDSEFFAGNIAQVQIYNRALSASEVLQNYNATKGRFNL